MSKRQRMLSLCNTSGTATFIYWARSKAMWHPGGHFCEVVQYLEGVPRSLFPDLFLFFYNFHFHLPSPISSSSPAWLPNLTQTFSSPEMLHFRALHSCPPCFLNPFFMLSLFFSLNASSDAAYSFTFYFSSCSLSHLKYTFTKSKLSSYFVFLVILQLWINLAIPLLGSIYKLLSAIGKNSFILRHSIVSDSLQPHGL